MKPVIEGLLGTPSTASQQPKQQPLMGLLSDPRAQMGMGLLSSGYDSRINPWMAANRGLQTASIFKKLHEQQRRKQAEAERVKNARAQFKNVVGPDNPALAAMADVDMGSAAKLYADLQRQLAPADPKHGQYNPRDYTTESWANFSTSGDPRDLVRYAPFRSQMIGGVLHDFDPTTNQWLPAQTGDGESLTPESVGSSQGRVAVAENEVVREADAQAGADSELKKIGDLQEQLDWFYDHADALKANYGSVEGRIPEFMRSQNVTDARIRRDRLIDTLALAARGDLKGQGPISDAEQGMLRNAQTALQNPLLGDDEVMAELNRLYEGLGWRRDQVNKTTGRDDTMKDDEYTRRMDELRNRSGRNAR